MRSSRQSLAMRSGILCCFIYIDIQAAAYTNRPVNSVPLREVMRFPSVFLSQTQRVARRHPDAERRSRTRQQTRAGELFARLQIIVLLCDCLLQQLKPLTQVGKLKLQWIRHNVFHRVFHCLFIFSLFLVIAFFF